MPGEFDRPSPASGSMVGAAVPPTKEFAGTGGGSTDVQPVPPDERVQLLDILRGFAILGMWTVNMTVDLWWGHQYREVTLPPTDFVAIVLVDLAANGKFVTIFSCLFGIGFFLQMERARRRLASPCMLYLRRSTGLLLIAVLAMALTIPSWILIDYALYGWALLLLFARSPRVILAAALACIGAAALGPAVHAYRLTVASAERVAGLEPATVLPEEAQRVAFETVLRDGTFLEVSTAMLQDAWLSFSDASYYVGNLDLLGLLLIGLYLGRRGAIRNPDLRLALARKSLPWLLGVGLTGCLVWVAMEDFGLGDPTNPLHAAIREIAAWPIGMPALGLGYAAAITLLADSDRWRPRLKPFAAVGRMALTNYLFTGLVAAFVSFRWGLGRYAEIRPIAGLAIVAAVYPLQIVASHWWLRRFEQGPLEWLWRLLTYGRFAARRTRTADV